MSTVTVADRHPEVHWSASPTLLAVGVLALVCCAAGVRTGILFAWVVPVVWAAVVDARVSRLPDRVVVVGAIVFVAVLVATVPMLRSWSTAMGAMIGALVLGGLLAVLHVASPKGLGYGDVKYGVLVGLGLGVLRPGVGLVVFVTAAVLQSAVALCRPWPAQRVPGVDRRAAPFGPALAIAAVGWAVGMLGSGGGV